MSERTKIESQPASQPASQPGSQPPVGQGPAPLGPMIRLTDEALSEVQRLRDKRGLAELTLRVGVKGGGCAGLSYTMKFDSEVGEKDHVMAYDGVKLVVDRKSAVFLRGLVLDFSDDLIGGGFKFENPNARRSCSCGTSFSA